MAQNLPPLMQRYMDAPGTRAMQSRLDNTFNHSPEVESSLRNMDTEKLVKVLASRPGLIPMSEWQSSPDMYDLYKQTRQELGLPTNEGRIQTKAMLPEGFTTLPETNYPKPSSKDNKPNTTLPPEAFAASASGAYPFPVSPNPPSPKNLGVLASQMVKANASGANRVENKPKESKPLQRFDQLTQPDPNLPAFDYNNQIRQRAEEEQQIIKDIQKGFVTGKFGHPSQQISEIYPTIANSEDKYKYNAQQQKEVNDQRAEARRYIQAFGSPQIQKYLIDHPDLLLQAQSDPVGTIKTIIKIEENKQTAGANPEMLGGVAPLSTLPSGYVPANKSATPITPTLAKGDSNPGEGTGPIVPNSRQSFVNPDRNSGEASGSATANSELYGVSMEDELASVRRSAEAAPKVSPRAEPTGTAPYRGPMTARDPLTRKEYAPVSQKDDNSGIFSRLFNNKDEQNRLANYQSDSSLRRSGPMGEESATDFVLNQPIYKKRMEDQPPMEARGGPIQSGGNAHDDKCHVGIIHMAVGGRTDHLPMNVYANSYVLPADVVSGLGEGNTLAGGKVIDRMFSGDALQKMASKTVKDPLKREDGGNIPEKRDQMMGGIVMPPNINFSGIDMTGGPMGSKIIPIRGSSSNFGPKPYEYRWQPDKLSAVKAATGGMINDRSLQPIEIVAAGGEYVIPPEVVRKLGHGNADAGHKWLDNFVKSTRAHVIKTMQNLPGPKKD